MCDFTNLSIFSLSKTNTCYLYIFGRKKHQILQMGIRYKVILPLVSVLQIQDSFLQDIQCYKRLVYHSRYSVHTSIFIHLQSASPFLSLSFSLSLLSFLPSSLICNSYPCFHLMYLGRLFDVNKQRAASFFILNQLSFTYVITSYNPVYISYFVSFCFQRR